jgi:hypothetical protein
MTLHLKAFLMAIAIFATIFGVGLTAVQAHTASSVAWMIATASLWFHSALWLRDVTK